MKLFCVWNDLWDKILSEEEFLWLQTFFFSRNFFQLYAKKLFEKESENENNEFFFREDLSPFLNFHILLTLHTKSRRLYFLLLFFLLSDLLTGHKVDVYYTCIIISSQQIRKERQHEVFFILLSVETFSFQG